MSTGQSLTIPFEIERRSGVVNVVVAEDTDPERHGLDLIFPDYGMHEFIGFPTCKATVRSHRYGYASIFGWTQLVKAESDWEMDPTPNFSGSGIPFSWFGPEPTLFDAPKRARVQQIDWTCHSFLTYIRDSLISKHVIPILGFEWGFTVTDGKPEIKALRILNINPQWNDHLSIMRDAYPGWTFEHLD